MIIKKFETPVEMGAAAAAQAAEVLRKAISEQGCARLLLSTGASQFEMFQALIKEDVDWSKVEMFHLDEYVGLPEAHPASFRKYLKERFANLLPVPLKACHFVDGEGDLQAMIDKLTKEIKEAPIDLGMIGVGENTHIAFNDPPADFDTRESYIVVNLDDRCKKQQMGEGWFATIDDVPKQAISMTPWQIMQSKVIISVVPHKVKADAVFKMVTTDHTTNTVPATLLKEHADMTLYLDAESAALL